MALLTFKKIEKYICEGKFSPIYFLNGEEPYYIDKICKLLIDKVLTSQERSFNQSIFYGKDADISKIKELSARYPMMSKYQLIIIREAQELKKFDQLLNYIQKPIQSTILVIAYKYKKLPKNTKIYKALLQNATILESNKLYDNKIPIWISEYISNKGLSIDPKVGIIISEYLGSDLQKIANELDKLVSIIPEGKSIGLEDVEKNIGISKKFNVFELQKAIINKDLKKLLLTFNYINSNPKAMPLTLILSILFNFFSKALILQMNKNKFEATAKELKINNYFLGDYKTAIAKYGNKLEFLIGIINEYELRSKGINNANTTPQELIKEMIFKIVYL